MFGKSTIAILYFYFVVNMGRTKQSYIVTLKQDHYDYPLFLPIFVFESFHAIYVIPFFTARHHMWSNFNARAVRNLFPARFVVQFQLTLVPGEI